MLPLPDFFAPTNAADWSYRPDAATLASTATAWRAQHKIKPSAADETRVHLLLIDVQKDFCFPDGTLYVAGRSGRGAGRCSRGRDAGHGALLGCEGGTRFPRPA